MAAVSLTAWPGTTSPSRRDWLTGLAALFDTLGGVPLATDAISQRAGGMLDPTLAEAFVASADELLTAVNRGDPQQIVLGSEPRPAVTVRPEDLRDVALVFDDIADLKSPYLHGHSRGVARLARVAGERLGMGMATSTNWRWQRCCTTWGASRSRPGSGRRKAS